MGVGLLLAMLCAGIAVGLLVPLSNVKRFADLVIVFGLFILLFAMGTQIGVEDRIIENLGTIGMDAAILCVGSVGGSILFVHLGGILANVRGQTDEVGGDGRGPGTDQPPADGSDDTDHRMTLLVVGSLGTGLVLGVTILPSSLVAILDAATTYSLLALVFGVGVGVGADREALRYARHFGWWVFAIPLLVAVGSVAGAIALAFVVGMPVWEVAAVGAGFGWYSYAGVVLFELHSTELGTIAFLANIFREIVTILLLPGIARHLGGVTSIAPGGATTMDVTLPIIREVSGDEFVVPALINGMVLSALAVVLVPFFVGI